MTIERGTRVVTCSQRAEGHTRLPGYLQRKHGVVEAFLGNYPLPDENALYPDRATTSGLYTIVFETSDVFGERAGGHICADLFEKYFEIEP